MSFPGGRKMAALGGECPSECPSDAPTGRGAAGKRPKTVNDKRGQPEIVNGEEHAMIAEHMDQWAWMMEVLLTFPGIPISEILALSSYFADAPAKVRQSTAGEVLRDWGRAGWVRVEPREGSPIRPGIVARYYPIIPVLAHVWHAEILRRLALKCASDLETAIAVMNVETDMPGVGRILRAARAPNVSPTPATHTLPELAYHAWRILRAPTERTYTIGQLAGEVIWAGTMDAEAEDRREVPGEWRLADGTWIHAPVPPTLKAAIMDTVRDDVNAIRRAMRQGDRMVILLPARRNADLAAEEYRRRVEQAGIHDRVRVVGPYPIT